MALLVPSASLKIFLVMFPPSVTDLPCLGTITLERFIR